MCVKPGAVGYTQCRLFFTWLKGDVCSKLDRVLVNNSWLLSNVNAFAEFLAPGCISDHSCYIVSLDRYVNNSGKNKSFKFYNMWTLHHDFQNIVRNAWAPFVDGTRQFILKQKLTALKKQLQRLNCKHFSHISNRDKIANDELVQEQKIILTGGSTVKDIKSLRAKTEFLMEAERLFFSQKARCDF